MPVHNNNLPNGISVFPLSQDILSPKPDVPLQAVQLLMPFSASYLFGQILFPFPYEIAQSDPESPASFFAEAHGWLPAVQNNLPFL